MTDAQRRKILQEWRLLPEAEPTRKVKTVSDLVDIQIGKLGVNERLVEDQMVDAWEEIVGGPNARLSKPVHIRKGELVVAVTQPALKYNFERFHSAEILKRLQDRFGKSTVRSIRFRVGS